MQVKVVIHESEDGGYWAEVPALPGCVTQADTYEELIPRLREAVEGVLAVMAEDAEIQSGKQVVLAL